MLINNKIKQILSSPFIRNASWLGGAELVNRIFRLGTTVTLARTFSPQDYGLAAIIYTTYEFSNVFTLKGGIGAKIIQADERDIKIICDTSYWLNWILCGSIFIIQCGAAFPIALFYGNNQLILPICTIALTYLMLPIYMVQSAMIQRENRLRVTALCNATQSLISNFLTVIFALLGMGIWAVVLPIVLSTPVWIFITYRNHFWRPPKSFQLERWQEITNFGKNMLGVEILGRIRTNIDYLIVGRFLGVEALGSYFFAFNAGVGISWNVMNSFFSALFPHLCATRENFQQFKKTYYNSLKTIAIIFVPFILLQSLFAPFYVPVIFGNKWISAIPILIIICLSSLPTAFWWAFSILLDALDKTHISFYLDLIFTIIFIVAILLAINFGLLGVAVAVLVSHLLVIPCFIPFVRKYLSPKLVHM